MFHVFHLIFLYFCLHISHGTQSPESGSPSSEGVPITGAKGTVGVIGENVKCNGVLLHSGKVSTLLQCWLKCEQDIKCRFVVWWFKSKKCDTYETCPSTRPVSQKTSLMRKITECDVQMGLDRQGPYIQQITSQFADNSIRHSPPNQNLWCQCLSNSLMICGIFVEIGSKEEQIVRARLDRSEMAKLKPFFIMPALLGQLTGQSGVKNDRLLFDPSGGLGDEQVSAEMQIMSPKHCIPMRTCVQGDQGPMCPITRMHVQSGDPIYVLKQDSRTIESKKPHSVLCLSIPGLRTLASLPESDQNGGFIDPFKRMKGARLQIEAHYEMYFIFTEELLSQGLCQTSARVHNEEFPRGSFDDPQDIVEAPDEEPNKEGVKWAQSQLAEEITRKIEELELRKPHTASTSHVAMSFRRRNPGETSPVFSSPTSPTDASPSRGSASRSDFRPFRAPQSPPQDDPQESAPHESAPRESAPQESAPQENVPDQGRPFDPPPIGTKCLAILHPDFPEKDLPPGTTGEVMEILHEEKMLKIQLTNGETLKVPTDDIITRSDVLNLVSSSFLAENADPPKINKSNPVYPSVGSRWMIRGFLTLPELNGQICKVAEVDKKKGKIKVKLEGGMNPSSPKKDTFIMKLNHLVPPEIADQLCFEFAQGTIDRVKKQIQTGQATAAAIKEKQGVSEVNVVRASRFPQHTKIMFFIFPIFTYFLFSHFYKSFTTDFYISLDSDADEI